MLTKSHKFLPFPEGGKGGKGGGWTTRDVVIFRISRRPESRIERFPIRSSKELMLITAQIPP